MALFAACRRLLVPLARLLLRQGIGASELKAFVDQAYVRAAVELLAERGEVVTSSRIAVLTGQRRFWISETLSTLDSRVPTKRGLKHTRGQRVLTGWYEDREFQTRAGDPAPLPLKGPGVTFETLVARYGGHGMRPGVIRNELVASGAIKVVPGKLLKAVRRTASQGGADPLTIVQMGEAAGALLSAFEQNLAKGPAEQLPVRGISRTAPDAVVPLFRAQMGKRADAFVEMTEAFLDGSVTMAKAGSMSGSKPAEKGTGEGESTLITYVFASAASPPKTPVFHDETLNGQKLAKSRARAAKKTPAKRPRKG